MGLAVLTSSFMALAMTVVTPAPARHPQAAPRHAVPGRGARLLARADGDALHRRGLRGHDRRGRGLGLGFRPPRRRRRRAARRRSPARSASPRAATSSPSAVTTPEAAQPLLQLVMLPLQLISGIYFPAVPLPGWLQHIADAFPLAHLTTRSSTRGCRRARDRLGRPRRAGAVGRRRGVRRRAALPLAAARLTGTVAGLFPLKDNIPTLRFPVVTVALIA